jgi:hypothetical protein
MTQEEFNKILEEREIAISLYEECKRKINNHLSIYDEKRKISINSQLEVIMNRVRIEIKLIEAYDKVKNRKNSLKCQIASERMSEFRQIAKFEKKKPGFIEKKLNDIANENEYPLMSDVYKIIKILHKKLKSKNEIVLFKQKTKRINELSFNELQIILMKSIGKSSITLEKLILMIKKDNRLFINNELGVILNMWLRKLNEINKIYPLTRELSDKELWFRNGKVESDFSIIQENDDG